MMTTLTSHFTALSAAFFTFCAVAPHVRHAAKGVFSKCRNADRFDRS